MKRIKQILNGIDILDLLDETIARIYNNGLTISSDVEIIIAKTKCAVFKNEMCKNFNFSQHQTI